MKQRITYAEWTEFQAEFPQLSQHILSWAIDNKYMSGGEMYMPTIGELIHFLSEWGRNRYQEEKIEEWFNNALIHEDVAVGWNGESLCDILWWEAKQVLRKL